MQIDLKRFQETFFEEAAEHLIAIESGLLQLEESGADAELLNTIFRSAHSIKGAAGSFGFTELARLTHVLENLLDQLRSGQRRPSTALTQLLLRASDTLAELVAATRNGAAHTVPIDGVLVELEAALRNDAPADVPPSADAPLARTSSLSRKVRIEFEPEPEYFRQGQDLFLLLRELVELGDVLEMQCGRDALPALAELEPERSYLRWSLQIQSERSLHDFRDVFLFVEGSCQLAITEEPGTPEAGPSGTDVPSPRVDRRAPVERRIESSSIRVPTEKVDALIDLVGELVISQAMVNQAIGVSGQSAELEEALATVQRSTRELQEQVMAIRMLPIGTVFNRFPRLVHDLGAQLGKRVRLEIAGGETELDKSVIEQLGDPLTHLIRNSVDHGVELPADRLASGKPEEGVVALRAFHEGGSVIIEVTDDGKGLDRDRIRTKAIAQGLIRPDAALSEDELCALIFAPGFSTATVVSDVSGRGVGMDVVKRNVEALNGTITVSTSLGQGSRFRIRLPLTLAILDGLSVQVGRETFIVPLLAIRQSVRPSAQDVRTVLGGRGEVFMLRGEQLPLVRVARHLHIAGAHENPSDGIVIVLETDGRSYGLLVDDVLGQQQVVVKSLEKNYRKVEAIMGATILGDGRVAFIVDVAELQRLANRRHASTRHEDLGLDASTVDAPESVTPQEQP